MDTIDLEANYGRSINPTELAKFLGLDRRTIVKYAPRWGGVEVTPGTWRFFEKRILEVLNAEQGLKRGIARYRASVTVQGQTLQKLFPDESKKSHQEALVWEKETKKELEEKLSQTNSAFLAIGQWSNEYLTEAENRFVKDTFQEKKAAFTRFYKDTGLQREFPVHDLTITICRNFLLKQVKERSGYAANKDQEKSRYRMEMGL